MNTRRDPPVSGIEAEFKNRVSTFAISAFPWRKITPYWLMVGTCLRIPLKLLVFDWTVAHSHLGKFYTYSSFGDGSMDFTL